MDKASIDFDDWSVNLQDFNDDYVKKLSCDLLDTLNPSEWMEDKTVLDKVCCKFPIKVSGNCFWKVA